MEVLGLEILYENNAIEPARAWQDIEVCLTALNIKDPQVVNHVRKLNNLNMSDLRVNPHLNPTISPYVIHTNNEE